jgi:hypothetical protein
MQNTFAQEAETLLIMRSAVRGSCEQFINTFCMFNRIEQFYYVLSSARYFFRFCFYNSLPQVFLGVFEHTFNIRNNEPCSTTPKNTEEVYYIKQFHQGT